MQMVKMHEIVKLKCKHILLPQGLTEQRIAHPSIRLEELEDSSSIHVVVHTHICCGIA